MKISTCFGSRPIVCLPVIASLLFLLSSPYSAAQAQLAGASVVTSTLPPPPALAQAQRLAARADYTGAIKKLGEISSSATYRNTPYGPEAIYSVAHLYEDNLHDDNNAISSLNTLVNSYQSVAYTWPHQTGIVAERNALGVKIDKENRAAALKGPTDYTIPGLWQALEATGYVVVDFFVRLTGSHSWSYWVALLLISVIVRLALMPLSIKQFKSMKETQRMQPLVKELQAKYKNDKQTLATKQMELYKEHGINPMAGCLPMVMQLPVFIYMYHAVWLYQYRFSHGTFAWIRPSVHRFAPAFFGANMSDQDILLLAFYSVSMYITQRMMPAADPQQAEMQKTSALMSAVLFFVLFQNYHFPSAFVLYWFFSNVVSTAVQMTYMRMAGKIPAPGVVPRLPSDGDSTSSNGNGTYLTSGSTTIPGSFQPNGNGPATGAAGTARGVIAPKTHPKKKRR